MRTQPDTDFILIGAEAQAGTIYVCQPGPDRNTWTAYDLKPGGALTNPRMVSGRSSTNWRGVPEFA